MNFGYTDLRLDCIPKDVRNPSHVSRGLAVPKQIVVGFGWICNWGHLSYPMSVTMALIPIESIFIFLTVHGYDKTNSKTVSISSRTPILSPVIVTINDSCRKVSLWYYAVRSRLSGLCGRKC